ncbi:hypothetical protein [Streptomyces sp. NPDC054887]
MQTFIDHARSPGERTPGLEGRREWFARPAAQAPRALFVGRPNSRVVPALTTGARPGEAGPRPHGWFRAADTGPVLAHRPAVDAFLPL